MYRLMDRVVLTRSGISEVGEIRGRTFSDPVRYDVKLPGGMAHNVTAEMVEGLSPAQQAR